jgi:hypothetical protein
MEAVKTIFDGRVFVPSSQVNIPVNSTVYLHLVREPERSGPAKAARKTVFATPLTDSITGILKGAGVATADDIKDRRLAKHLP